MKKFAQEDLYFPILQVTLAELRYAEYPLPIHHAVRDELEVVVDVT